MNVLDGHVNNGNDEFCNVTGYWREDKQHEPVSYILSTAAVLWSHLGGSAAQAQEVMSKMI